MATTIVVNVLTRQDEPTDEAITLDIIVKESDFVGVYDQLQIWRSTSGMFGLYEELTAMGETPAVLPENAGDPAPVTGTSAFITGYSLGLQLNRDPITAVTITFTGPDPETYADAAAEIASQAAPWLIAYVDSSGRIVLKTFAVGAGAAIQVLSGDAAALLGLSTLPVYGKEARLSLSADIVRYSFTDLYGSSAYHYKTRFYNSTTQAVGEFSQPFCASTRVVVSPETTICGFVELVQVDGRPLVGQDVRVYAEFTGALVNGKTLVGSDLLRCTDAFGRAEFRLVRGHKVTVSIPGTNIYRTITVPTDPAVELFNLLEPGIADEDVFTVAVPKIVIAERRSLE